MIHTAPFSIIALAMTMAFAGYAFGLLYFAALRRTVTPLTAGKGWAGPLALTAGRIAAAVGVLTFSAKLGAAALLMAFLGFLLARTVALHRARSTD